MNKKIKITSLFLTLVGIIIFSISTAVPNARVYERKVIIENVFNVDQTQSSFGSKENVYIDISPTPSGISIHNSQSIPVILGIDKEENYYLGNNLGIKLFDKNGYFLMHYDYIKDLSFRYLVFDEINTGYLYLSNTPDEGNVVHLLKFDLLNKKIIEINDKDYKNLPEKLKLPQSKKDELENTIKQSREGNYYYQIAWGKTEWNFVSDMIKYMSPESITILKFDNDWTKKVIGIIPYEYINKIPEKYFFDRIKLSEFTEDKIMFVSSCYINNKANVFITGVKSNDVVKNTNYINLSTSNYFLWKFEKQN